MQNIERREALVNLKTAELSRYKMNGLITRLFCTECLSFCTISYGCYVWVIDQART